MFRKENVIATVNSEEPSQLFKECYLNLKITNDQLEGFENLKSDEDRIKYVSKIVSCHKLPTVQIVKNRKNDKLALELKDCGNKAFGKGDFNIALKNYTEAAMNTSQIEGTKTLALILANRSAALYHLDQYDLALTDIDCALQLDYPKELKYKVYERKSKVLLALNRHKEAEVNLKKALKTLDDCKLSIEKKKKIQNDIEAMLETSNKSSKNLDNQMKFQKEKSYKPQLISPKNKIYEAACDRIEIKKDISLGRHATAADNIAPGDTLLIERPFCAVLLQEYCSTNCQQCFKRTLAPYPCKNCNTVIFCSLKCMNSATYHKYECPILKTLHESGLSIMIFMALRILTQNSLNYFLNLKSKLKNKEEYLEKYNSLDYIRVYNLVRHETMRTKKDFFERSVLALFLLRCLKLVNYFNETGNSLEYLGPELSDDEAFIGSLLLRHLQILQFNAHEISMLEVKNKSTLANSKSVFIGGGLYSTLALFNHSCDPGIVRYFIGTKVVVRAAKPIAKGEIVAENYGPIYSQINKDKRQENLQKYYWFTCNCDPCLESWPTFEELDPKIIRFRCSAIIKCSDKFESCKNVLEVSVKTEEFMIQCSLCKKFNNLFKSLKALQETDNLYEQATKNYEAGNYQAALEIYFKILSTLHEILAPPFKDYLLCQQSIRKCMLALGNKCVYSQE